MRFCTIRDWFSTKTCKIGQFQFQSPLFFIRFSFEKTAFECKNCYNQSFFETQVFIAPLSTNIAQILDWIIKEYLKQSVTLKDLTTYLRPLWCFIWTMIKFIGKFWINVLISFRKSHYIGDFNYLVLFSIRTIWSAKIWNRTNQGPLSI